MGIQDINLTAINWWKDKTPREKYTMLKRCFPDFTGEVTYGMIKKIHKTVTNELPERKYTQQEVDEMLDAQACKTADQLLKNHFDEVRLIINKFAKEFSYKIISKELISQQQMVQFSIDWFNENVTK